MPLLIVLTGNFAYDRWRKKNHNTRQQHTNAISNDQRINYIDITNHHASSTHHHHHQQQQSSQQSRTHGLTRLHIEDAACRRISKR